MAKGHPPKGNVLEILKAISGGKRQPPERLSSYLGQLHKMGFDDTQTIEFLGGEAALARHGLVLVPDLGRLSVIKAQEHKDRSLAEKAKDAAAVIIKKVGAPQYDLSMADAWRPQHGGVLAQSEVAGGLRAANSTNDVKTASRLVYRSPLISQAVLSRDEFRGNFKAYQPVSTTSSRVRLASEEVVRGSWQWSEADSDGRRFSWFGVNVNKTAAALVRRETPLAERRDEPTVLAMREPQAVVQRVYERTTVLTAEDWFMLDDELVELLGHQTGELPNDRRGEELKPDESAELMDFVRECDELVAPSLGLLVVTQSFAPHVPNRL